MRFIVAAEDRSLRYIEATPECDASNKNAPKPEIRIIHSVAKDNAIQCLTLLNFPKENFGDVEAVAIASRNGAISILEASTGDVLASVDTSLEGAVDMQNKADEENAFVSIECAHGMIATCTSSGQARFTRISSLWGSHEQPFTAKFDLPAPISVMKLHPELPGVIVFGGKENDLQVWSSAGLSAADAEGDDEGENEGLWTAFKPVWKAKNVKNDELDLRVPVWIADIQFLVEDSDRQASLKILTATRFGQLRIYDTGKARRPLRAVEISQNPISQILLTSSTDSDRQIIFTDSHANIMHVALNKFNIIGSYKGFAGALASIHTNGDDGILVAGGMDSFLRAFSVLGHQQLCSIHIGARINHCLVLSTPSPVKNEVADNEFIGSGEEEDEDVWGKLEEVTNASRHKRIKRE